jgi:hypothetical protein
VDAAVNGLDGRGQRHAVVGSLSERLYSLDTIFAVEAGALEQRF